MTDDTSHWWPSVDDHARMRTTGQVVIIRQIANRRVRVEYVSDTTTDRQGGQAPMAEPPEWMDLDDLTYVW